MLSPKSYDTTVRAIIQELGYERFGFASLSKPATIEYYENWIDKEMYGEMSYLRRHLPIKKNLESKYPGTKSAIVLAFSYVPHPEPIEVLSTLNIAAYAQGSDYHYWLETKLNTIVEKLLEIYPDEKFYVATDSSPILERDLAREAGLGFFGKNTCLIDRKHGSYFLIGEILTSLELTPVKTDHKGFCGTCTRCIDACPTSALVNPYVLNSRKCISYLTIESKKIPPVELRDKMGDQFFGCDICQRVCPWNDDIKQENPSAIKDLHFLLESADQEIKDHIQGSPLERAKPQGLRRNALVVIGNLKLKELKDSVTKYVGDSYLGELATWTLQQLENS